MSFIAATGTGLVLWIGGGQVSDQMSVGELVAFCLSRPVLRTDYKLHGLVRLQSPGPAGASSTSSIPPRNENHRGQSPAARAGAWRGRVPRAVQLHRRQAGVERHHHRQAGPDDRACRAVRRGKSTLVNLLPAFYETSDGKITIDGQSIADTSLQSLRRNISVVSREPFLFNGTAVKTSPTETLTPPMMRF